MSSKIDERVVQMKFNSAAFEKGVESTTKALGSLKDALNLENIDSNLEKVASNFNVFGAVGFSAIQKLTNGAIDAGIKIGNAMWEPLVEGGRRRALNLEQARFQFENLGVDVVAIMADVDYAVDGTAYSLDSAAKAAASLSASQVATGEGMKMALRGISGVAALTGQEYDRVADIFTKVAGQGRVMGGELQQLNSLGMNAAATLKDYMNETGLTVNATEADIRKMASESQISFEIFAAAMDGAFGENAKKANDTYSGSLDNLRGALARIGALHYEGFTNLATGEQLFSGQLERQRDLFNALRPKINDVKNAIVPLAHVWSDMQKYKNDNLIDFINNIDLSDFTNAMAPLSNGIRNLFNAFNAIVEPIKAAWKEIFPPKATTWMTTLATAFEKFTGTLILGAAGGERIKGIFVVLFSVLKTGFNIVGGILSTVGTFISLIVRLGGAILGLLTPLVTFFTTMFVGAKDSSVETKGFFDIVKDLMNNGLGPLIGFLQNAGKAFDGFLNGDVIAAVKGLAGAIQMVWNVLAKGDFTENALFAEDSKFVEILFKIRGGIVAVVDAFKDLWRGITQTGEKAVSFWDGIAKVVKQVWDYIKPFVQDVTKLFKEIFGGLDLETVLAGVNGGVLVAMAVGIGKFLKSFSGVFESVGNIKDSFIGVLDELGGALGRFAKETAADKLIKIAGALIILAAALWVLSQIDPDRLVSSVSAMAVAFGILLGGMYVLGKIEAKPSIKASIALTLIAAAVSILASAIVKISALDPKQLVVGLIGITAAILVLVGAAAALSALEGDILKSSFALVVMATALAMVAGVVALFGSMPMEMIVQGFIAVTVALGLLVGAAVILEKHASGMAVAAVGLMAMAAALNMMIVPITALGFLPIEILTQGMFALAIILLGLVLAAGQLAKIAPQMAIAAVGMMAMAVALNLLVLPIIILGMLPLETLVVGIAAIAAVLLLLVVATNAMTTAAPGAVAMMAVAAAVLVLSIALSIFAAIGIDGLITAILGLVAALAVMGLAALILAPLAPVMLAVAGAMALFGLGMMALGVAVLLGVVALMLLGPALMMALGGLIAFGEASDTVMAAVGPIMALGAALLIFGAGALVAGVGALVLGTGLLVLGAGLALVAAVGLIGSVVLGKVVEKVVSLLWHVPGMLAMGAAFLTLGAGVLLLGTGLIVLAAGALAAGFALMLLVPLGALVMLSVDTIIKALAKLVPVTPQIAVIGAALEKLGSATVKLAVSGKSAASGLGSMTAQFIGLSIGAITAASSVEQASTRVSTAMALMLVSIAKAPAGFQQFAMAVTTSMAVMNAALTAGGKAAEATASNLGRSAGVAMTVAIVANNISVFNAAVGLGNQMGNGMKQGLQNGSMSVQLMAARVATSAYNAAKKALDVRSPSRKFAWLGDKSTEGLAVGLIKNVRKVETAGTKVGNSAIKAVQKSLTDLKSSVAIDMDYSPTIRPILDLSNVKKGVDQMDTLFTPLPLNVNSNYARANSLALQQETQDDALVLSSNGLPPRAGDTYNQYINSPKAVSQAEIYRNTKNLISIKKGES